LARFGSHADCAPRERPARICCALPEHPFPVMLEIEVPHNPLAKDGPCTDREAALFGGETE